MQLARTVGAVVGIAAAIATTGLISALPASAHTHAVWAKCVDEKAVLHVDLKAYNTKKGANHVTVSLDGEELESVAFAQQYTKDFDGGDPTAPHAFKVVVSASDNQKYSFTLGDDHELDVPACAEERIETTTAVAPVVETVVATTTLPAPPATTTTPVPVAAPTTTTAVAVAEGGLANTGASIAIPLVIGLVLLGGGVTLLVVLRRRARA
ncbi:hypothetical protein AB0I60_24095 [Actinosynnema sp. NPDC050436]|uniref:hypothetical protein n=1 Tax=Actinosynnema sp. NPDC050436 TaxID=3155659 RepID=UPI0033E594AC